jgi:branched-chain amino acid transport system ATP-binding protein
MLKSEGVTVRYGELEAVRDLSLEVRDGEFVGLFGRNGAGKSTFLMALAGFVPRVAGSVSWQGESLDGVAAHDIVRKGISLVPQDRELFANMSVKENLDLGAPDNPGDRVIRERMDEVLEYFPRLRERFKQRAGTMSGGEQQMLAIARALMAKPRLLLLDEPSTGLSPIMVDQVAEVMVSLRKRGLAVLLVEQNTRLGLELVERAYVLESGELVATGDAEELASNDSIRRAYFGV